MCFASIIQYIVYIFIWVNDVTQIYFGYNNLYFRLFANISSINIFSISKLEYI